MQSGSRPASTSTRPALSPLPRPTQHVNTQTKLLDAVHGRLLCVADIRGRLSALNDLAREVNASAIIHTGDFGFFEASSLDRINDRTLRHLTMYSPLIPQAQRTHLLEPQNPPAHIRQTVNVSMLSEFPLLLSGQIKLAVPVYTVWGACEDVLVLEKFRTGSYAIDNLHVIDEATTRCLDVGGVKLRLLGLGGALVPHKMFDNGDGSATIAGGQGTMWTTALQMGELVDTAQRVFDQTETRVLVTHASPGREGIINQLALVLKADLTISAGLHFRYATSYNEFSVQGDYEGYRHKLLVGKDAFDKVWESVKGQVDIVIDDNQRVLLDKFLSVVERIPPPSGQTAPTGAPIPEEPAWKNCWNWNLCDAAYGSLVLDVKEGRVSAEIKSQGFNYAYRRTPIAAPASGGTPNPPTKTSTPAPPADKPAPPHLAKSAGSTPLPRSGKDTPGDGAESPARANGASTPGGLTPAEKAERKKEKKKERKERERAEREAREKDGHVAEGEKKEGGEEPKAGSGKATPSVDVPEASASTSDAPKEADRVMSPATDSAGGRTPTSKRPPRNPWTLFVRSSTPANEGELREFFGEAASGIIRVNYPTSFSGRSQKTAFVEFGDEEAMKAGLEKHAEKLKDTVPEVKQAQDREPRENGPFRGGRGGRGRGGFAARGLSQAGLTRGGAPHMSGDRKTNGDAPSGSANKGGEGA
ncbi:hypothetical protein GLOTRDRAFT_136541 [Gloeophyllum trabeum ATCC 11539]|uniref:RRM domain-containing protein n=1 Tax=Gloeophyllum trabeum (strain ATCC 11539 / FP-39264 / Madison 617) TaxID=670483 RepID=S7QJ96_GLOTA|nr:uncharacterized protein GLOTRDRAFT_136541 [Gloeophyllum trabeum ATCC 11539]EPQ59741.1 hypothetical protein GLOTRDRAFT_136541 [Gloeophyllum trabeum ATCC 11539]